MRNADWEANVLIRNFRIPNSEFRIRKGCGVKPMMRQHHRATALVKKIKIERKETGVSKN
jgi:hypothetical protein